MKTKIIFISIFLIMSILGSEAIAQDEPLELKILSSWGPEYLYVQEFLIPYIEKINNETDGRIHATWVGPEAVPPFEQMQPLSSGLFDMLFSHPAYHLGEVAVGLGMDLVLARPEVIREAGFYEVLDEAYESVNAKVLALVSGDVGYHIMLKKPLYKADFTGLKLRTTPGYDPFANALGASTVQIPAGEIYSALEKGVVDAAAWPVFGALDYKWYEVSSYQLRPQFGRVAEIFLINLDTWKNMSHELQDLLMEITINMEAQSYNYLTARVKEDENKLIELGMELNILPEEEGKKLAQTYLDATWKDIVIKYSPDFGPRLKAIADKIAEF